MRLSQSRRKLTLLPAFLFLVACARGPSAAEQRAVVAQYVQVAHATYGDSLSTARALEQAVKLLVEQPGPDTLAIARTAWRVARIPYAQTEALRFGHWNVDDWEGRVNAWPVDEGLLDYVAAPYNAAPDNPVARANLVANDLLEAGPVKVDTRTIGPGTLRALNGLLGLETNVASGYHVIEFYLWGQDLNAGGPGDRPWTDYAGDARCTRGKARAPAHECAKRAQALQAAVRLLVSDLLEMEPQWNADAGSYGSRLVAGDLRDALRRMLFGMGSLALEELSGERIQTALLAHEQEEEQDCFSDQTHYSHFYNAQGIENFYFGRYSSIGGELDGASLSALVAATHPALDARMRAALAATRAALQALVDSAEKERRPFDQLIAPGDAAGEALLRKITVALTEEAAVIEAIGAELKLLPLNPAAAR